jgi:ABC-type sugar transport system substrate-binding protein
MSRRGRFPFHTLVLRALAAAVAVLSAAAPAGAQGVVANPQYDAMFRQVLREPANLDLSFRFGGGGDPGRRLRGGDRRA